MRNAYFVSLLSYRSIPCCTYDQYHCCYYSSWDLVFAEPMRLLSPIVIVSDSGDGGGDGMLMLP